jgi:CheY-like chemotaxis protein
MTVNRPMVLGVDEDRSRQSAIAHAFNDLGVAYRFITDRRRLRAALDQLAPDLLVLVGELDSDFTIQALDTLVSDVAHASRPVLVISENTRDASFVSGLRTGVVAILPLPFQPSYVTTAKVIWNELPSRPGTAKGSTDSEGLERILDTIRRTRRSGLLQTQSKDQSLGKAFFNRGKLDHAAFGALVSRDALKAIANQGVVSWTFSELTGKGGDGSGVVLEFGNTHSGEIETEVATVPDSAHPADEPLTFEVPIPRASTPTPPPAIRSAAPDPLTRLLLVDDDTTLLRMFNALFAKHGFEVTTATDGERGMEAALGREFDVVLADLNMPRLDGWGLLRLLRDDYRTRELPVAFLSAHDDYRDALKALNAGAQAYLSKGTKLDTVVGQVQKLLVPRALVRAQLEYDDPVDLDLLQLGPQWLLRQLAAHHLTGSLQAKDGFAEYTVVLNGGAAVHALALAGKYSAEGERAFNAFVASRGAAGTWIPGQATLEGQTLFHPTEVLLERAATTLNTNEQRVREDLLVKASRIEVNDALYAVYREVGPPQWLEAARLICVEKLPPREVIARLDASPVDIEETMRDLVRRSVISLKKG